MSSSSIAVSRRCASSGTEHKAHKGKSRQKSQKKEHRARKPEVAFSPVLKRRESWAARPPALLDGRGRVFSDRVDLGLGMLVYPRLDERTRGANRVAPTDVGHRIGDNRAAHSLASVFASDLGVREFRNVAVDPILGKPG